MNTRTPLVRLLATFSLQELRQHQWRSAAAVLAVTLGVALAFSVHLINNSALGEFASAVRSVNGQSDLELRAQYGSFDEALYGRVATHPGVDVASPVLELTTIAAAADGRRVPLRVVGVDGLVAPQIAPALAMRPQGDERLSIFLPGRVFLNAAAQQAMGLNGGIDEKRLQLQIGAAMVAVQVAGSVAAPGQPLAVMDLGAAQDLFGRQGQLSRIDVRLAPGADRAALLREIAPGAGVVATEPGEATERVDNLSRAYRVNLTVLALVALFTGAFLVFSVMSLSVARRQQQFALLGVLGLTPAERQRLVICEAVAIGLAGSAIGIALGTALAAVALRLLGGDLGGGFFAGSAPSLQWSSGAALVYGVLGVAAAVAGGLWPARDAARLAPALALKGLGAQAGGGAPRAAGIALMAAGVAMALAPPVAGIALGAYVSVGLLLVGGIVSLPWLVALLYDRIGPWMAQRALPMLAVERARRMRGTAAVAVSGVVASLSLSVALTVMVASFRDSVTSWLDVVLPAPLYMRSATAPGIAETIYFSPEFVDAVARTSGVRTASGQRVTQLLLRAGQPQVALLARPLNDGGVLHSLPLTGTPLTAPAGAVPVYVSEPIVDLYGMRPGMWFDALAQAMPGAPGTRYFVAGVWRDYARQSGAIAIDSADFVRITGDRRVNDVALSLVDGADEAVVEQSIRALAAQRHSEAPLEFFSAAQIRATSLRIFDRSFAVTYWLQAVAIGIGLFGVAASFSAQVLARRKEFGLLAHLGLTRRQILAVVAGEGAAWTVIGAAAGLALGIAVSVVLVHVVNPQSFHWTMDLMLPWPRLAALCAAVVLAGTLTAWIAGRAAAGRDAVLAVKEDW